MAIRIVTESQTCLPPAIVDELGIIILPLTLQLDGRVYRNGIDISHEDFYRMLPTLESPARTSAISPGEFLETFQGLAYSVKSLCLKAENTPSVMSHV